MKKTTDPNIDDDILKLVALERRKWSDRNLLAPESPENFQELADEAFRDLKSKYDTPSKLGATMKLRAGLARKRTRAAKRAR